MLRHAQDRPETRARGNGAVLCETSTVRRARGSGAARWCGGAAARRGGAARVEARLALDRHLDAALVADEPPRQLEQAGRVELAQRHELVADHLLGERRFDRVKLAYGGHLHAVEAAHLVPAVDGAEGVGLAQQHDDGRRIILRYLPVAIT
eukprot:1803837-Prymnesium_polylepis.2